MRRARWDRTGNVATVLLLGVWGLFVAAWQAYVWIARTLLRVVR